MAAPNNTDKTISNNIELLLNEISGKKTLQILIEKIDRHHETIKTILTPPTSI